MFLFNFTPAQVEPKIVSRAKPSQKVPRLDFPESSQAKSTLLRIFQAKPSQKLQSQKGWNRAAPKVPIEKLNP